MFRICSVYVQSMFSLCSVDVQCEGFALTLTFYFTSWSVAVAQLRRSGGCGYQRHERHGGGIRGDRDGADVCAVVSATVSEEDLSVGPSYYTLYTPLSTFIAVHTPMYTHYTYIYTPYSICTANAPLNTLKTPYIRPKHTMYLSLPRGA